MLNAVLQHVKGVLNGLPLPGQAQPLDAKVVPPPLEGLTGVKAWITPGTMSGSRQTMPRGPGFTQPRWAVDITIDMLDLPTDSQIEQSYYLCVDAVLMALFADTMPVPLVDPTTNAQTQLLAIGEEYGFTAGNWVVTASGRAVLFRGRVTTTVKEALQTGAFASRGS